MKMSYQDELGRLRKGANILSHDAPDSNLLDTIPDDLDMAKFERGQQFFRKNLICCQRGMLASLILGLSLDRLLDVLVVTGETSDPIKSFKRLIVRLAEWCSEWYVRLRHSKARKIMDNATENVQASEIIEKDSDLKEFKKGCIVGNYDLDLDKSNPICCGTIVGKSYRITQYDMALVQAGFIGTIIMYPKYCGILCSISELDDFVYLWRWIGYALGMEDQYNICVDGYEKAYLICKSIEKEIVIPSLKNPPKNYESMAKAVLEGIRIESKGIINFRLKPILALAFECSGVPVPFSLTFGDRLYMLFEYMFSYALMYVPGFARFLSFCSEMIFGCSEIT